MNKITLLIVASWCITEAVFRTIDGQWLAIATLLLGIWVVVWTICNKQIRWF